MSRIRAGVMILLVILAFSVAATVLMQHTYPAMAAALDTAAREAEAGNWPAAQETARRALEAWEKTRTFTAIFADHSPMDDMDGLFAELQTYIQLQEMPHFAATCRHLSRLAQSMGENHALVWWNLL